MRCCVQNCLNDDSKKTNKSHGITFHKLPKHPDHSAAWLAALARLGCRNNKCLLVCCEHFLPEDFDDTRPYQRRVKSGAVPTIMAPLIQEELKVCRVCLALDVKMYNMKDFKLSQMFKNITGISAIDKYGSILQRVCWECAARLTAAAAFRDKALLTDALLKSHVHLTKRDIETLKLNRHSLKSALTVQTVFTSSDVQCERTIPENRDNKIRINEKEIEIVQYEPWINVPVKTEVESDPIADNNMRFQDRKSDTVLEHFNDKSPREDIEDEMTNTELKNDKILRENTQNDRNNILVENSDNLEKQPELDDIGNIMNDFSSDEDAQSSSEEVSVNKSKLKMSSKVGTMKERATISKHRLLHNDTKQRIIALKQEGMTISRIAHLLKTTRATVHKWWNRWCNDGHMNNHKKNPRKRKTTVQQDQLLIERVAKEQTVHTPSLAKELGITSKCVRIRLMDAGFKLKERKASVPLRSGRSHMVDKVTKQQIISMKHNGVSVTDIANQFRVTMYQRAYTLQKLQEATENKGLNVTNNYLCVRIRLTDAGFKLKERKASVPLRSGRSHMVDKVTKQQIISMKHNGVSVTDIANQFRVTRTSVYLWWRRWCKENNIKTTRDKNINTTTEQEQSLPEHINVQKVVQTPLIISSQKSVWQKLPDVEFINLNRS